MAMVQLRARAPLMTILAKYSTKKEPLTVVTAAKKAEQARTFASEADPKDYGYFPDPIEHATGLEKKMIIARLAGDDRYEPKVYYRAEHSTRDKPNLVPAYYDDKIIACLCEPDTQHLQFMMIRKGTPRRCQCGHWFKVIETGPDFF